MTQSYSKGTVNVTGNVTAIQSDHVLTITSVAGSKAGVGNTILGTVPANKRWRILGVTICGISGTGNDAVSVTCGGQTIAYAVCSFGAAMLVSTSNSITFDYAACPIATAGQTIAVTSPSANITGYATVTYSEESI